jgi:S1-C subfamily serine protease
LHRDYPNNKSDLAAKRGPRPEFARPELFPMHRSRYKSTIDYAGKVVPSCIHCHQIGDAARDEVFRRKEKISETMLFPYPHPKSVGLVFDPKEMATILEVIPKSPVAEAGFEKGDVVEKLAGQPLLSIADVQWVLHQAPADRVELIADVVRRGKSMQVSMMLDKGWRQRDDISWRASTWSLRRKALGGMFLKSNEGVPGLFVEHVGQYAPHNVAQQAGFRKGDIILEFDGKSDLKRETDVIAYSLWKKKPGEKVPVLIQRNGRKQSLTLPIPE